MRRLAIVLASVLLLTSSLAWAHDEELQAELLDEVLRLTQAEVPDDIIIEQIRAWEFIFELSADDIVELRTLGVSDTVLEALIATAGDDDSSTQRHVVFTAGYYAPWYWFPVAWGGYYDPFPNLYCAYYYPFHYSYGYFGYYGWCRSTYYAHYNPGRWQREAWHRRGRTSPYLVASRLPAQTARTIAAPARAAETRAMRASTPASSNATLRRSAALRSSVAGRQAQQARTITAARRTTGTPSARRTLEREFARRRDASRIGATSVREARRASPLSRMQSTPRSHRGEVRMPHASSWSRVQAPARAASMPRFQSMSRAAPAPRSMSAPSAVGARLGRR